MTFSLPFDRGSLASRKWPSLLFRSLILLGKKKDSEEFEDLSDFLVEEIVGGPRPVREEIHVVDRRVLRAIPAILAIPRTNFSSSASSRGHRIS